MSNQDLLKELFEKRHKRKPELRERQSEFFIELIQLTSRYQNKNLGVNFDGQTQCPITKSFLKSMLMPSSSGLLSRADFFFEHVE